MLGRGCDGCAPVGWVDVMSVLGEEPVVAFEVLRYVLAFAVDGLVEFFKDVGAGGLGVGVVSANVLQKDGESLGMVAELGGTHGAGARTTEHDVGGASAHLNAADGVAVTVVLGEAEDVGEPVAGSDEIVIDEVGEDGVDGDGAVSHGSRRMRHLRWGGVL